MALLDILHYPDPRLYNRARAVERVDDNVRTLIDDMLETMYAAPGIGLAAVQVNQPLQVITIDISEERNDPLCLVNPEILAQRGTVEMEEGCLSVPGVYEVVPRSEWIRIKALSRDGDVFEMEANDLLAVCIQHEMDHLEGKLFVDYLSQLKRQRIRKKARKLNKQATL
ncbi:MAG TPA: peptide deformylase [Gammaproteobacteria bacterium]|nr:peptide deformylase [Gammaproteobacteria bacterium]